MRLGVDDSEVREAQTRVGEVTVVGGGVALQCSRG
jgi:hypothetical protein